MPRSNLQKLRDFAYCRSLDFSVVEYRRSYTRNCDPVWNSWYDTVRLGARGFEYLSGNRPY